MTSLSEEQQERLDIISHKLKFMEQRPTVAIIKTLDPIVLAADEMKDLVATAGGVLIEGDEQTLLALNPDVIMLMPNDMPIAETMSNMDTLLQLPGFAGLKAVKNNRLYIVDSAMVVNDAAENAVDTIEMLAEIIYPKQFIFGYEGNGWIKFSV
ncbi:ABC transporter substrate-binding protein [Mucilaginibacter ximonensis]|uniref:ABC transporter substrate-binding protein n=1 Tax=Mucilaginibacter ximonensis TaxID=538021 RepID=A0ABW5YDT3_9SPHI